MERHSCSQTRGQSRARAEEGVPQLLSFSRISCEWVLTNRKPAERRAQGRSQASASQAKSRSEQRWMGRVRGWMKENNKHGVARWGRRTGLCSTTASHFADEKMEAQRQEVRCQLSQSWEGGAAREAQGSEAMVPRPSLPGQAGGPQVLAGLGGGSPHALLSPSSLLPSSHLSLVHPPTFGLPGPPRRLSVLSFLSPCPSPLSLSLLPFAQSPSVSLSYR